MTNVIDKDTVLANRYCIKALELETTEGEKIYQAVDQILGRNVSVFFPSPSSQDKVVATAKNSARNRPKNQINVLDISALNASQIFIVTTTARAEEILRVLTSAPEDRATAENRGAESHGTPPTPVISSESDGYPPLPQKQPTEKFSFFETGKEEPDTERNELDAEYLLLTEEERQDSETGIPLTSHAAHDFIIPFHTESRPILNMQDADQSHHPEEEGNCEHAPTRKKNSSLSWILGAALAALVLVLAYAGIYVLSEALKTSSTAAPNSANTAAINKDANPKASQGSAPLTGAKPLEIVNITRSIDGSQDTEAGNTSNITNAITSDSKVWSTLQYSSENFGGFFKSLSLSLELKEKSTIHEVAIEQQGTTGGMFTVYASDNPTPGIGAKEIAQGSFTGPDIKLPLSEEVNAQYVIVTFTQLPKLQNPHGSYPYGIRLTNISVS